MSQLSHSYLTTGKTIALIIWIFAGKIMSLIFNMLSSFVTAFLLCTLETRAKAVISLELCGLEEGLLRKWGVAVDHCGEKDTVAEVLGSIDWHKLSQKPPFWHQDLTPSNSL